MALREEFVSTGNWLFRWRSYLPIILIGVFLVAVVVEKHPGYGPKLDHLWASFCLAISYVGLAIRIFTIGFTPSGTSGRNTEKQVADSLNTAGIYSLVRNPLYLGNSFMWLGIALFTHLWLLTIIAILFFWIYYERIIFAEEAYLIDKFGDQYVNWANETPAFLPKFNGYREAGLSFSWRNILRREYNGFFAVIFVMFVFDSLTRFVSYDVFEIDFWWLSILGFGFVVWMILRSLKKYTTVLEVEGR